MILVYHKIDELFLICLEIIMIRTFEFYFDVEKRRRGIVKTQLNRKSDSPDFTKAKEDIRKAISKDFGENVKLYSFRELNCVFQDDEDCYDFSMELDLDVYVKKSEEKK